LLQLGYACRLGSGTEANESHAFAHFRAAADAAAESIQNIKDDVDGADDDMVAMFQDVQGEACCTSLVVCLIHVFTSMIPYLVQIASLHV
jgi:hypothetical protein